MKRTHIVAILIVLSMASVAVDVPVFDRPAASPASPSSHPAVSPTPNLTVLPPIEIEEDPSFADDRVVRIRGLKHGEIVGRLTVPDLKLWNYPIRFGVGMNNLSKGPSLYPGSAAPGEGNFSMAGHRITPVGPFRTCSTGEWGTRDCHGPFRYVNELTRDSVARVMYHGKVFHYRFVRTIIVDPTNISILRDGRADMTFTACHPPGYATQRIVAQWELVNG